VTDSLYRASACSATVWPRWRPEPVLRRDGDDVALAVAPHALVRQGQYPGLCRPLLSHPPFLFLTPPRPEQQQVVVAGRPPPRSLQIRPFGGEESWEKRSPPFPEGIAPIFSSFNRAYL